MDYQPSICIITPTIGRPSLAKTLMSGADQLGARDQWVVLGDGINCGAREIVKSLGLKRIYYTNNLVRQNDYGNSLRDTAMKMAGGAEYFVFLDDDDVLVPGAIATIKREIARYYGSPIMFRMINGNGEVLWKNQEVTPGNVGGSMFCCPNKEGFLGVWANGQGHRSDYEFIRGTLKKYSESDWRRALAWSGEVIIQCRPGQEIDNNG